MNWKLTAFALFFSVLSLSSCSSLNKAPSQREVLPGNAIQPIGRFEQRDKRLELISSAAHFRITFEGKECTIYASLDTWQSHNYLQYELDGVYQKRLRVKGGPIDSIRIVAPHAGKHVLQIFKATEAHTGPIFIHQLRAHNIKPISVSTAPLIEFIGNSITCGAAADPSEVPCGTGEYHDQHNAYMAYGPCAARALGANYILSSVSGIGVYRNWNSEGPTMPKVYEKLDLQETSARNWDFNSSPKIVSIALGTNDFSNGDGQHPRLPFDPERFTGEYVKFVKNIKSKYPKAQILLLNSPMVGGSNNEVFKACLNKVKQQIDAAYPADKTVEIFFFEPMQPHGCTYHPNVEDHEIMANRLIPFLKKFLK